MTKRLLPLSLLVSAAITIPSLAIAAPVNQSDIMPADMRTMPVDNTLQAEIEGDDGELLATQPGAVDDNDMDAMNTIDMEDEEAEEDEVNYGIAAAAKAPSEAKEREAAQVRAEVAQARAELAQAAAEAQSKAMAAAQMNNSRQRSAVTPADMREAPAAVTLQEKKKDRRGELLATQPAQVDFKENRRIAVR